MNPLTLFGLFAVSMMLICYALENRSPWFIFAFSVPCALGSAYGFLQGAWPFGLVEAVWSADAFGGHAGHRDVLLLAVSCYRPPRTLSFPLLFVIMASGG